MNKQKATKNLIHTFLLIATTAIFLSGCGKKDVGIQPLPIPTGEEVVNTNPGQSDVVKQPSDFEDDNLLNGIPIIGTRIEKDGMFQSYLTGEWKDVNVAKRRPFAMIIPNDKQALPQYGLSAASVVFEAPVEGRMTRLLAFVEDYDDLERIGPARSARDYFIYEAMGKEAIFCSWGLTIAYCGPLINSDRVDNVSQAVKGIDRASAEAFKRFSRPGYSMEYTGYMVIDGYIAAVRRLGYDTHYSSNFTPQFVFAAEFTRAEYADHPDATIIRPGGTSSNRSGYGLSNPYFEYNPDDRLYYRFEHNAKHIDEMNNQQLSYSNVIFQYMHGEVRDNKDYMIFEMHSSGRTVKVFTNGKVIEGTWSRTRDGEPARFFDKDGFEIVLNQGKTWICLIWEDYSEFAIYE